MKQNETKIMNKNTDNQTPNTSYVGLQLPEAIHKKIKALAEENERSLSAQIRMILREALGEN